ncbi:MAG: MFS transporter [Alphaproteobacteria bacterium]
MTDIAVAQADARSARGALASLSLAMLLSTLGTSIANVALPTLTETFGASFQTVQWVVLAYLLAITTLVVGAGRLGDIVGSRRLLIAGFAVFTAGSAFSSAAPTLEWLIAARAVQGIGAAVMMSLSLALVGATVPKERTGSAMGLLGTMSAIGTALGPSLGGVLIAAFGWHAIFFVSVPLGLVALLLAFRYLPADSGTVDKRFDIIGTLVLALTLAAYALAMTIGRGQFGPFNAALLLASAAGAALFIYAETKVPAPLISLAMVRDPALRGSLAMSALVSTVLMGAFIVGPFYLSHALGLGAALVGAVVSAGPIVVALTGIPAGRLVDRFSAPRITVAGLAGITFGCFTMSAIPETLGIPGYVAPLVIMAAGYALFQTANNTAVMAEVSAGERGLVSGLLTLARNLGLVTGASAIGAVFAFASGDVTAATPQDVAAGMRITFAVSGALSLIALGIATRSAAAP